MKIIRYGCTRIVFLVGRFAIKVPQLWACDGKLSWSQFLHGLLANMQEVTFSRARWPELCPVKFHVPGGFLVIMPRCEVMPETEQAILAIQAVMTGAERKGYIIPAEGKANSWGTLDGRMVALDYGNGA